MIVLTLIAILVGIAIPIYRTLILRSRESTLKVNLHSLREVIDQYTADKKKAPQTLQDLVDAGYFREMPLDPMTGHRDTWTRGLRYECELCRPDGDGHHQCPQRIERDVDGGNDLQHLVRAGSVRRTASQLHYPVALIPHTEILQALRHPRASPQSP